MAAVELCDQFIEKGRVHHYCVREKGHAPIHGDYRMHVCVCGHTWDEWVDKDPEPMVG